MISNIKGLKETLEKEIENSSNVFIIGHNGPDFDAIGSSIGLYKIITEFGKRAYIIVEDEPSKIEPGVKKIMDENKKNFYFIKKEDYLENSNKKSLLILTDVNKKTMISVGDSLDRVGSILVIDHHNGDSSTVETENKYITPKASSASEIVARLLFSYKINFNEEIANYLLAGISLDTKRFKQNTTSKTHDVAKKLIEKGANIDYVNSLFLEEFESFCRISNLIINGTTIRQYSDSLAPIQVSFTLNRNSPTSILKKEDYAKAADRMMRFYGIDASFALGYVDERTVHISARGGKKVNVGKIMQSMNGGGNNQSAGGRLETEDIFQVEEQLMDKINLGLSEEEEMYEEPKVIKVKQIRREKKI